MNTYRSYRGHIGKSTTQPTLKPENKVNLSVMVQLWNMYELATFLPFLKLPASPQPWGRGTRFGRTKSHRTFGQQI